MTRFPLGCLEVRCGDAVCHIETIEWQKGVFRCLPYVQDRLVLRTIFDRHGRPMSVTGDSEREAVSEAIGLLVERFGPLKGKPAPCLEADRHIKMKVLPLKWTDAVPGAS